jgi:hypothetical protein
MKTVIKLSQLGYEVSLNALDIALDWKGSVAPDPEIVKPLFEELKKEKEAAIRYLEEHRGEVDQYATTPGICGRCVFMWWGKNFKWICKLSDKKSPPQSKCEYFKAMFLGQAGIL